MLIPEEAFLLDLIFDWLLLSWPMCMVASAHRLETIVDSDMILILDDGKVVEYDTPARLMAEPESAFSKMLKAARRGH